MSWATRAQITDKGKQSKKGKLTLERTAAGGLVTVTEGKGDPKNDVLVEVFRDGDLCLEWTFEQIRLRAALPEYTPLAKAEAALSDVITDTSPSKPSCCSMM